MKSTTAGVASGCVVWLVAFFALGMCICPLAAAFGSITAHMDFAVNIVAPMICPANTTPHIDSYQTTMPDDFGNPETATAYDLQCLNADGTVVKTDPVGYAFLWLGILVGVGLIAAALLAFVVAGPVGVLIARLMSRRQQQAAP